MIEAYQSQYPLLKVCQGEAFERDHWRTLLKILQLKPNITLEKLTFGDLLQAHDRMMEKAKDIRELGAGSQGEVALREAVLELKVWCETAKFDLYDLTSNGRNTPLIKEWKDLMTSVSDKQSLVASLKENRFSQKFQAQIDQFDLNLGGIDEYLGKLNTI